MAFTPILGLGPVVKGPVTNPNATAAHLFTIANGAVLLRYIIGRVSTVMGAVNNNTNLEHDAGPRLLCAVLDNNLDDVPTRYHISGDPAAPLRRIMAAEPGGLLGGLVAGAGLIANGFVLLPGHLDIRCAANNTGATIWVAYWIPLEPGATLVAS